MLKHVQARRECRFEPDLVSARSGKDARRHGTHAPELAGSLAVAQLVEDDDGKKLNLAGAWPKSLTALLEESGLNVHVGCSLDSGIECPWNIDTNH